MNETIKTLMNHRSIRDYKKNDMKEADLHLIIEAAQCAPSSINGQHVSIIAIKDPERKAKVSSLSNNQPWINQAPVFLIFCADFYRAKLASEKVNQPLAVIDSLEATIIGSVDVGLSMQNAIIAAESLGYGIVPIGGVRANVTELVQLLDLPPYVFPICGLVIGEINDPSAKKPRLPMAAIYHEETYNQHQKDLLDVYDETMRAYMLQRTNGKNNRSFSETIAGYYKDPSTRDMRQEMEKQGYHNK